MIRSQQFIFSHKMLKIVTQMLLINLYQVRSCNYRYKVLAFLIYLFLGLYGERWPRGSEFVSQTKGQGFNSPARHTWECA